MKKGFTMVELLAVLAIMTIILLMAVPSYTAIVSLIQQRVYDSKIKEVLSKSEMYAEEYGKTVFNIKALIESGKIEADNELGEFEDPRDGRDMSCDMISVLLKESGYEISITEDLERNCYDADALENLHGITNLKVVNSPEDETEVESIVGTNWLKKNSVAVTYELKEDYKEFEENIESILWYGEEEKICTKELGNLEECKYYSVTTSGVTNTEVHFQIKIRINGVQIQNENSKSIQLDIEYPIVLDGSITKDDEYNANSERRVQFEITDKNGSGVKEYLVRSYAGGELSCQVEGYQETSEGVQTAFLESGQFYICVKDKVGNVIDDETLNREKEKYLFEVDKVSTEKPKWKDDGSGESIKVVRSQSAYNDLNPYVSVNVENAEGGIEGLKLCISSTGYLEGCSWVNYEGYSQKIQVSLPKQGPAEHLGYDGGSRTVYVTVQDKYGNTIERTKEYVVYKACTVKTGYEEVSNTSSSCPKCGVANYKSEKKNKDEYIGVWCDRREDTVECNIPKDCCSSTVISGYGPWKSCSVSCGGGIQRRDIYYVSAYDSSKSCPTKTDGSSQACNTQSCDPVASFDTNDYNSSKNILCDNDSALRLLQSYVGKFQEGLNSQAFRNAMYDCSKIVAPKIRANITAWNAMLYHSRTTVVSGRSGSYGGNGSNPQKIIYGGKAFIMGYSQNSRNGTCYYESRCYSASVCYTNNNGRGCASDEALSDIRGTSGYEARLGYFGSNIYGDATSCPFNGNCTGLAIQFYIKIFPI